MNIELLNEERKRQKLSISELAEKANLPKSTVEKILFNVVKFPRIDTMQAIERALGLAPTWTAEEQALGVGNHATVLSQRDLNTLTTIRRAEDVLGTAYVDKYLEILELAVQQKLKK